jgi:ABC-type antimicrobial peptide transport system permease subunit
LSNNIIFVNTENLLKQIADANDAINILFIVIVIVTMIIAFFIVWVSVISNIREHLWEIGVMRAEGVTKLQLTKIIFIESLSIVVLSLVLGVGIGAATTAITVIQMDQLLERKFTLVVCC